MYNDIRDVIIVKNIIFKENGKGVVDHTWEKGRPCVVISNSDDWIYVLPLSTQIKDTRSRYFIEKNNIEYDYMYEGYKRGTEACFDSIMKIKECGRLKIGVLKNKCFLDMLRKMISYCKDMDREINIEKLLNSDNSQAGVIKKVLNYSTFCMSKSTCCT